MLIQDYSRLTVTPGTATARNGASIVSYSAVCSGVTKSNTTGAALSLGTIGTSGTRDITLTVTDSRGIHRFRYPERHRGAVLETQGKLRVPAAHQRHRDRDAARVQRQHFAHHGGWDAEEQPLYARYRYKLTSASSYNSYTSILGSVTATSSSFSFSNLELCNLDSESSYDFHLQIRDQLNSLTSLDLYFVVSQGTPLVALRKKMVGINTPKPGGGAPCGGRHTR